MCKRSRGHRKSDRCSIETRGTSRPRCDRRCYIRRGRRYAWCSARVRRRGRRGMRRRRRRCAMTTSSTTSDRTGRDKGRGGGGGGGMGSHRGGAIMARCCFGFYFAPCVHGLLVPHAGASCIMPLGSVTLVARSARAAAGGGGSATVVNVTYGRLGLDYWGRLMAGGRIFFWHDPSRSHGWMDFGSAPKK